MKSIEEINTNIPEGKLLLAALAIITTESRTDQTPDQVLQVVVENSYSIFNHNTSNEIVPNEKCWPESSNVEKTEFDNINRVLVVTFKNNKKYAYQDFLEKDWKKLLVAKSIGKHINSEVKGVHLSVEITEAKPAVQESANIPNSSDL
jgi:hypothetical protein